MLCYYILSACFLIWTIKQNYAGDETIQILIEKMGNVWS